MSAARSTARPCRQASLMQRRQQDVFPRPQRLGVDSREREHAGDDCRGALGYEFGIGDDGRGRGLEGSQHRQGAGCTTPRSVDGEVGGLSKSGDALSGLTPFGQTLTPACRFAFGKRLWRKTLHAGFVDVHPRGKLRCLQIGEGEQQVREVAFRVDDQHREAVNRRLLNDPDAQAGLAAAGHPENHGVGDEIGRVVEQRHVGRFAGLAIDAASQIEEPELLVIHRQTSNPTARINAMALLDCTTPGLRR